MSGRAGDVVEQALAGLLQARREAEQRASLMASRQKLEQAARAREARLMGEVAKCAYAVARAKLVSQHAKEKVRKACHAVLLALSATLWIGINKGILGGAQKSAATMRVSDQCVRKMTEADQRRAALAQYVFLTAALAPAQ
jgi:hypothetical protein